MAEHIGWPSFWWLNAAMTAFSLLVIVCGFPETMFSRAEASEGQSQSPETSSKVVKVEYREQTSKEASRDKSDGSQLDTNAERDPWLGRGTPNRQQWMLFQRNSSPFRSIMLDLWIPWKLFTFPIVLFASFIVSWSCSCMLILNLTQTQVFTAPPYNLSSQSVGMVIYPSSK